MSLPVAEISKQGEPKIIARRCRRFHSHQYAKDPRISQKLVQPSEVPVMFGFKNSERSKKRARDKAWEDIHSRHNAALEAERRSRATTPQPPSKKKAGFGKRTKESR
jgi:hypothetical protein